MVTAQRLDTIHEYYFSQKLREIEEMNKSGRQVINLGIGSPDLPPHPAVVKVLQEEAAKPQNHAYQGYKGTFILRNAIAGFYKSWYGVTINAEHEILPLIGSKEGIMHICMSFLNEGDEALIPDPGYPTYSAAVALVGGRPVGYQLLEKNNYEPDFAALENMDLSKVKLMFVNFPHMPTGKMCTDEVLKKFVDFANKHGILLVNDNAYSFILNPKPTSIFNIAGAYENCLELNSLSKSHNMAGWRVGMLCGRKELVDTVLRFKSNMDSGMFLPVQLAAAKALEIDADWFHWLNNIYFKRRKRATQLLQALGCNVNEEQVGMFVWAKAASSFSDGFQLSDEVLHKANVFITPGGIFGPAGTPYIRISLCNSEEKLMEAIDRIGKSMEL